MRQQEKDGREGSKRQQEKDGLEDSGRQLDKDGQKGRARQLDRMDWKVARGSYVEKHGWEGSQRQ